MLNELLTIRFGCPVCGRILYPPIVRGYWCPYCGADLNHKTPIEINMATSGRLTARAESGLPYYIGKFTGRERCYAQDMGLSAIAEVLEKLAQYEDAAEEEEAIDEDDLEDKDS